MSEELQYLLSGVATIQSKNRHILITAYEPNTPYIVVICKKGVNTIRVRLEGRALGFVDRYRPGCTRAVVVQPSNPVNIELYNNGTATETVYQPSY